MTFMDKAFYITMISFVLFVILSIIADSLYHDDT